jgi:hypothetical protein
MAVKRLSGLEDNIVLNGTIELVPNTIVANYTFPAGYNGSSSGPVVIANNVIVTIPTNAVWTIK